MPPVVIKDNGIRRPALKVPTLSEDLGNFLLWLATFNSAVGDSTTLSNVDKMVYLKSFLAGEALHLIMYMEVNNANYQIALDLLKTSYINKRNEVKRLVLSLFKLECNNANYMELLKFAVNLECNITTITLNECPINPEQP